MYLSHTTHKTKCLFYNILTYVRKSQAVSLPKTILLTKCWFSSTSIW